MWETWASENTVKKKTISGECYLWLDCPDINDKKATLQRAEIYICWWFWTCEYLFTLNFLINIFGILT